MGKMIIRRNIYPELYIHVELKQQLSIDDEIRIKQRISEAAERVFWETFGIPAWSNTVNRDFSFENQLRGVEKFTKISLRDQTPEDYKMIVVLEEGSLKVKIFTGISVLYFAIGSWGDFVSGSSDIAARLRWAYDHLLPAIYQIVGQDNIQDEIKHERRIGAVGRFDELVKGYQKGQITERSFLEEGNALLQKIAQSEDSDVLLPLVSHYLNQQYGIEMAIQRPQDNALPVPLQWNNDRPTQLPALGPIMLPYRREYDEWQYEAGAQPLIPRNHYQL